nr:hypothetical protein BaRGS_018887 [Batillaria attramentaria]
MPSDRLQTANETARNTIRNHQKPIYVMICNGGRVEEGDDAVMIINSLYQGQKPASRVASLGENDYEEIAVPAQTVAMGCSSRSPAFASKHGDCTVLLVMTMTMMMTMVVVVVVVVKMMVMMMMMMMMVVVGEKEQEN